MKKEQRILLYSDSHKKADFENSIESVQSGANELIQVYETLQDYNKIESLDKFILLVQDPIKLYDTTLQENSGIDLKSSGGKIPQAAVLAQLYDIPRDAFISIIKGEKIIPGSCKSCSGLKIKKTGSPMLSNSSYQQYSPFLLWDEKMNRFQINESAVFEKLESFNYYIEDPKQIECYHFWHNVCDVLNSLQEKNYCTDIHAFQTLLKNRVMFSYANNKLNIDETALLQEINSLKN